MVRISSGESSPRSTAQVNLDDPFAPNGGDPFAADPFSVSPPFELPGDPFGGVSEITPVAGDPFGESPHTTGESLDEAAADNEASITRKRGFGRKIMQIIRGDKGFVRSDTVLGDIDSILYKDQASADDYRLPGLDNLSKAKWGDPARDILNAIQDEATVEDQARSVEGRVLDATRAALETGETWKIEKDPRFSYLADMMQNDSHRAKELGVDRFISKVHGEVSSQGAMPRTLSSKDLDEMFQRAQSGQQQAASETVTARMKDAATWKRSVAK